MLDLVALVADKNMQHALRGILGRHAALQTRPIKFEILIHPGRDGGVRTTGPQLLALHRRKARHGLLLLDLEGSGSTETGPGLEANLNARLDPDWSSRATAIVIEPELDIWVWGAENRLQETLGWTKGTGIRDWLGSRGFGLNPAGKPLRPKESLESVLRQLGRPRSSALYGKLAERVSLNRCADPAFLRLRSILTQWFPAQPG